MSDEAPVPPVYDHVVERLAQRLADGDENAYMPEYRKRAAKLLAEAQKPTPVPLAEQPIDALPTRIWSDEHQAYWRKGGAGYTQRAALAWILPLAEARARTAHCGPEKKIDLDIAHDHVATLKQHERAMAVVEAARKWRASLQNDGWDEREIRDIARPGVREISVALAALDDAARAAGDAG